MNKIIDFTNITSYEIMLEDFNPLNEYNILVFDSKVKNIVR